MPPKVYHWRIAKQRYCSLVSFFESVVSFPAHVSNEVASSSAQVCQTAGLRDATSRMQPRWGYDFSPQARGDTPALQRVQPGSFGRGRRRNRRKLPSRLRDSKWPLIEASIWEAFGHATLASNYLAKYMIKSCARGPQLEIDSK